MIADPQGAQRDLGIVRRQRQQRQAGVELDAVADVLPLHRGDQLQHLHLCVAGFIVGEHDDQLGLLKLAVTVDLDLWQRDAQGVMAGEVLDRQRCCARGDAQAG